MSGKWMRIMILLYLADWRFATGDVGRRSTVMLAHSGCGVPPDAERERFAAGRIKFDRVEC